MGVDGRVAIGFGVNVAGADRFGVTSGLLGSAAVGVKAGRVLGETCKLVYEALSCEGAGAAVEAMAKA